MLGEIKSLHLLEATVLRQPDEEDIERSLATVPKANSLDLEAEAAQ